jgi:hypothetical protein
VHRPHPPPLRPPPLRPSPPRHPRRPPRPPPPPPVRSQYDYAERNGYVKGVVTQIAHDPGRGAPVMMVKFRDPYRNQKDAHVFVAPEGVYSGQFIYSGAKAEVAVGNILPVGQLLEGASALGRV